MENGFRTLKILHVIPTLAPNSGGPTQVMVNISKALDKIGHKVAICTTDRGNPTNQKISEDYFTSLFSNGVESYVFPVDYHPVLYSHRLKIWLDRNIKYYDLIHIHSIYRFPVTYAAWRARKASVPYIIRPHGSLDPFLYHQSSYNLMFKRIFERLFDIPNLNNASAIHYTTTEEAKRSEFLALRAKHAVVPNGIDWSTYKHLPSKGFFRKRLGLDGQTPLVLFLGRINFKKGLDFLVSAFSRLSHTNHEARLAIVGPDNEGYGTKVRRWCREQGIENKTFFMDYLGAQAVKQAYVDADVFVLPSYTENFGITVVEAMACGCPVVISDQVNIWREVQDSGAGFVVGLDPGALSDAIANVLKNKNESNEMGRFGRSAAEELYSWSKIVKQLTQLYRSLISEQNRQAQFRN